MLSERMLFEMRLSSHGDHVGTFLIAVNGFVVLVYEHQPFSDTKYAIPALPSDHHDLIQS